MKTVSGTARTWPRKIIQSYIFLICLPHNKLCVQTPINKHHSTSTHMKHFQPCKGCKSSLITSSAVYWEHKMHLLSKIQHFLLSVHHWATTESRTEILLNKNRQKFYSSIGFHIFMNINFNSDNKLFSLNQGKDHSRGIVASLLPLFLLL